MFGGTLPILNYIKNLKLVQRFADALSFSKGPTSTFTLPQICVTQVAGRLLGKERISHFEEMEQGWSTPRRIVAVRMKEKVDDEQMELFPEDGKEYEWLVAESAVGCRRHMAILQSSLRHGKLHQGS